MRHMGYLHLDRMENVVDPEGLTDTDHSPESEDSSAALPLTFFLAAISTKVETVLCSKWRL